MFYKMPADIRNFLVNYFSETVNLPMSFKQVQLMISQIVPMPPEAPTEKSQEKPTKKATKKLADKK